MYASIWASITNTLTEYQPVCIIRDNKSWKINPVCFSVIILPLDIALHIIALCDRSAGIFALSVIPLLMFFSIELHSTLIPVRDGANHCFVFSRQDGGSARKETLSLFSPLYKPTTAFTLLLLLQLDPNALATCSFSYLLIWRLSPLPIKHMQFNTL